MLRVVLQLRMSRNLQGKTGLKSELHLNKKINKRARPYRNQKQQISAESCHIALSSVTQGIN